jgi:anti-sigma B factor antagonist
VIALDVAQRGNWHVLSIVGDLDVVSAPKVRNEITRVFTDGAADLVIDLVAVPFLDSFGLGVLIGALKRARAKGGRLALVVADPGVRRLLDLTGLDEVFEVVESVDEAIED